MQNKIVQHSSLSMVILLMLISLFPLITAHRYPAFLTDDAYITLTYAKNLASGNGFVFNHPPAILGTTTPLFTIIVSVLALFFSDTSIIVVSVFLTAFCWLGVAWLFFFFRTVWGLADWQVGTLALVVIGSGWIHFLGMEAYLFAFLLILSFSLFLSERYLLAGFTVGLLFLTRGEGVLVLAILLMTASIQHWNKQKSLDIELVRKIIQLIVSFTCPILLWIIYAQATFGSFLPNTLAAKQAQGQNGLWNSLLRQLISQWIPSWGESFTLEALPFINFWWLIVLIGLIDILLRKRRWLVLVGWIALYILGYTLLNVAAYGWYRLPILFVLNILFGMGVIAIVEVLTKYVKPYTFSLSISGFMIILLDFALAKPTFDTMLSYQGDIRGVSYTTLSQWFREHTDPSASIAFIEVGYLGYYTDNQIIDLAGLLSTDMVPHIAEGDFAWGFWHYKPDYYVYLPDFDWALASIRIDPRFDQQYQSVATLPGPRETDFIIYERIHK
jgi:hypothetical protein